MKVVIFHADIEYLVRMGEKKLKQIQWAKKPKKRKKKKPTNGFVSLPTKFHLAHFTCCLF